MPTTDPTMICPYCGIEIAADAERCPRCTGQLDPFNRRLIQQHLGPWFLRLPQMAYRPGCSYGVLKDLVRRGVVEADTVVRGPTTRQYWMYARDVPGVAHLLGLCHACGQWVRPSDKSCPHCSRPFPSPEHRNYLGLDPDNHRLVLEAVRREQAKNAPNQTARERAEGGSGDDRPLTPLGQAAAEANPPTAASAELFELAAATTGKKQAPNQNPLPKTSRRGGRFFWMLVAINFVLVVLLLLLIAMVVFGEHVDIFAADAPTLRGQVLAWAVATGIGVI